MHLAIFWGMAVLAVGTALATVDQDFPNLPFDVQMLRGNIYRLFELGLDLFGVVLIAGLAMAAYRRYRYAAGAAAAGRQRHQHMGRLPVLASMLLLIAVTGFVVEGLRIAEGAVSRPAGGCHGQGGRDSRVGQHGLPRAAALLGPERQEAELRRIAAGGAVFSAAAWAPVGYGLARLSSRCRPTHPPGAPGALVAARARAFGLIVAFRFTKAFHIVSSPVNILLAEPRPGGAAAGGGGVGRGHDPRFHLAAARCSWTPAPGAASARRRARGTPAASRSRPERRAAAGGRADPHPAAQRQRARQPSLHGGVDQPEELWACCTCRACEDICPVGVQHPRLIVDLRRSLIDRGQVEEGLQDALMNLQRYGNSLGQSPRKRAEWAKDRSTPSSRTPQSRRSSTCGSWATTAPTISGCRGRRGPSPPLFQRLGVDFGILEARSRTPATTCGGSAKKACSRCSRRRTSRPCGRRNSRSWSPPIPHTYNTLKNEYQAEADSPLAGRPVLHYTELFDQWLAEGKLRPAKRLAVHGDVPRPLLPGPVQRRYTTAAAGAGGLGGQSCGRCPVAARQLLLRRRRRPGVDEGHPRRQGAAGRDPRPRGPGPARRGAAGGGLPEGPGHVPPTP